MRRFLKKNNTGITLVALAVTVVVLIILTGITIKTIGGNDGLIAKAKEQKNEIITKEIADNSEISQLENKLAKDTSKEQDSKIVVVPLTNSNTTFSYSTTSWTNGNVTVTISTSVSGYQLQYSIGNTTSWQNYTSSIVMTGNGLIYARLINGENAGGYATGEVSNIDKVAPTVNTPTITNITDTGFTINETTQDSLSGISKVTWYYKTSTASSYNSTTSAYTTMNGTSRGTTSNTTKAYTISGLTSGTTYNVFARVYDVAGNYTDTSVVNATTIIKNIAYYKGTGGIVSSSSNTSVPDDNRSNVVVPAGFKIASDSATDQNNGVVIEDESGNQFVWIPVADATSMYQTITSIALTGTSVTTTKSSKSGIISGQTRGITGSTDYREPDILSDATYGDSATQDSTVNYTKAGFTSLNEMATAMRDDYEAMIGSVNTNKGFYVGRYELTGSVATPTEKSGTTLANITWYNAYKACKAVKSTTHAQTSMIWGCQWDTVCNFIANNGDKKSITDSSSWGNYGPRGSVIATGSNSTYKANNIYDIAGNCYEWTQEAGYTNGRVVRGGCYAFSGSDIPASSRSIDLPNNIYYSSRAVLYIK